MNLPDQWEECRPGIFRTSANPVVVDDTAIDYLKSRLPFSPLKRVRLCAHAADADPLHEMLIAMSRGTYIRPHCHLTKTESFHMIEGEMDVVIFDESGRIERVIPMGPRHSGNNFYYRLAVPAFHSLVITTPVVVFQEITSGPFNKAETLYAPWSPHETDLAVVGRFQEKLVREVAASKADAAALNPVHSS